MTQQDKDTTEKNIRAIYKREKNEQKKAPLTHRIAGKIADFAGTVTFVGINAIVFALWMGVNLTVWKFDPYPFTLLTMLVSLESIFLSTFVLISQNQMAKQTEDRNKLDLQVNLLAEQEATAMSRVVVEIAEKMGIDGKNLDELKSLTDDIDPEEVLEKIAEVEGSATP